MKYPIKGVEQTIDTLLKTGAWKATKFVSEKAIIRASRRSYKSKTGPRRIDNRGNIEVIVTFGHPNFAERQFIKSCKKAGEPLPVKKIQLKFASKK